jgi:methyl coenzyme M reductase subunit D
MKRAEDSLTAFQTCHRMLQVDFAIQNGHKVRMNVQDAQKARDEWKAYRQRLQALAKDNAATVESAMVLQQEVPVQAA